VALKKPSDFFGNKKTPLDEVKEEYIAASPEKIEQVSEAFGAFKANLNHIKSLSDFTSTFDSFRENLEKVENVSSEVDTIKNEIKSLLKQEDLDSAMMAQLLFVEESISKIESKISSINGETVDQIKEDFKGLSTSVEGFLSIDVPKYKKLISESEVRIDDRFGQFKDKVEENLDTIRADVNKEVTTALSEVEKLNTDTISEVKEDFKNNTKEVKNLVEEELPKYRKFFTETELKTEETIKNAIDSYKETIENLNAKVKVFTETEIPKYNNLLIETKLKSEKEVKELEEEVLTKVNSLSEKVDRVSGDVTEKTTEKIEELQTVIDEYKEEIDSISKTYNNLYKDFKKREISDNEKLEGYSNEIEKYNKRFAFLEETVTEDLREIQSVLIRSNETYHTSLKAEVGKFRSKISEQMEGLQMDLVVNEQHIKKQNENIETVKEEIQEVLKRLQLDTLEEKNKELVEKIAYLEETISEINEKKLLVEDNPTLPGDPSTNNSSDGLTPLDQKFATLDDLQNHYRLFINRIQQQIATIGGGGAGFIYDLDDVSFDVGVGTGKLLIYDGAKWVGIASTAVGGGDASTLAENTTGTNLVLSGNLSVAGIATYEDVRNIDSIGIITARDGIVATGVVTATAFHGDGSQLTGIIAGVGIQSGATRVGTAFTDIKFVGTAVSTIVGSGSTVTINLDARASTITRQFETVSTTTSDFTITGGYDVGLIDVFLNGVKQRSGTDFLATSGTGVTMTPAVNAGDVLEFQKFEVVVGSSGGSSGITTAAVRDEIQGYYAYSTDLYTVGVANTSQELEEDTFTLVQPQIGAAGTQYHLPTVMSDVFGQNPWVGTGATIGTGQTQFSLAGLSSGASATVRVGCQFNPDVDNTNLDVRLTFTTNTATQGTGLTNFSITKEQALIMNEGADQNYSSESVFSFFVGDTLEGTTKENAGSFNIQVRSSELGTFEMAAFAVNVVA
jgi:hypothetical protein